MNGYEHKLSLFLATQIVVDISNLPIAGVSRKFRKGVGGQGVGQVLDACPFFIFTLIFSWVCHFSVATQQIVFCFVLNYGIDGRVPKVVVMVGDLGRPVDQEDGHAVVAKKSAPSTSPAIRFAVNPVHWQLKEPTNEFIASQLDDYQRYYP